MPGLPVSGSGRRSKNVAAVEFLEATLIAGTPATAAAEVRTEFECADVAHARARVAALIRGRRVCVVPALTRG